MKVYNKKCVKCGKEYESNSAQSIYCSRACKYVSLHTEEHKHCYDVQCATCEKIFEKRVFGNLKGDRVYFCSLSCSAKHKLALGTGAIKQCKECGADFEQKHGRHYFCSNDCKTKYGTKHISVKEGVCSNCGEKIKRTSKIREVCFCNKDCEKKYKYNQSLIHKECAYCKQPFTTQKGKKSIFCSIPCRVNGMNKGPTVPHQIVIEVLNSLGRSFEIEKRFNRYCFDIFIAELNLNIEIMGQYWHCDHRLYKAPVNKMQEYSIVKDLKKHAFFKETEIKILYLWEYDIKHNIEVCRKLLEVALDDPQGLFNCHSFNYTILNGELKLKENIEEPLFMSTTILPLTTETKELHFGEGETV